MQACLTHPAAASSATHLEKWPDSIGSGPPGAGALSYLRHVPRTCCAVKLLRLWRTAAAAGRTSRAPGGPPSRLQRTIKV